MHIRLWSQMGSNYNSVTQMDSDFMFCVYGLEQLNLTI